VSHNTEKVVKLELGASIEEQHQLQQFTLNIRSTHQQGHSTATKQIGNNHLHVTSQGLTYHSTQNKRKTKGSKLTHNNHRFTSITQVNLRQLPPSVKNWRILLVQSFTARMPLLTGTSAFGLGRRRWSSPQQCYLHCLRTF